MGERESGDFATRRLPLDGGRWFAALPWLVLAGFVVATGIVMISGRWTPVSDDAMITSFGLDVVGDTPLVGMPTSLSLSTGTPVRHPGPLPFWLIGIPARVFGAPGYGVVVAVVATNVGLLVLGAAACAGLRPRAVGPVAAVFCGVLILSGLGADGVIRPFNPYFGVLATFVALVSAASVISGTQWALPIFVASGSLAAQSHVTLLPIIGVLLLATTLSLGLDWRRARTSGSPSPLRRSVLWLSVAIGALLWSGPLIDQAVGSGNLLRLLQGGGSVDGAGWRYGVERLVDAIAPPALWTTSAGGATATPPSAGRWLSAAVILVALVGLAIWAARARHRTVTALCVTCLAGTAASVVVSSRVPSDAFALASPANQLFWWPVGCVVYLGVLISGAIALQSHLGARRPWTPAFAGAVTRGVTMVALLACVVSGVTLVRSASAADSRGSILFGAVRQHAQAIDEVTRPGGTVRLVSPDLWVDSYPLIQALIAQLRLRGIDVQVDVADPYGLLRAYREVHPTDGPADVAIYVRGSREIPPPPDGSRVLSQYKPRQAPADFEGYASTAIGNGGARTSWVYLMDAAATSP